MKGEPLGFGVVDVYTCEFASVSGMATFVRTRGVTIPIVFSVYNSKFSFGFGSTAHCLRTISSASNKLDPRSNPSEVSHHSN